MDMSNFKISVSVHRLHLQDSGHLFIIIFHFGPSVDTYGSVSMQALTALSDDKESSVHVEVFGFENVSISSTSFLF